MQLTLFELAEKIQGRVVGDGRCMISRLATLEKAEAGTLSFFHNLKYRPQLETTAASAVILNEAALPYCKTNALVVPDAYFAYATLAALWDQKPAAVLGVHPTASIGQHVILGKDISVGAYAVIGDRVVLGDQVVIGAHTTIEADTHIGAHSRIDSQVCIYHHTHIGERVRIYSGAVIGADGFGNTFHAGQWHAIPQLGAVWIGNDVTIGANTAIDRGALEDTRIGHGARLDNLIQVGHNVEIGNHTAIAGGTLIAGSAKIGNYCMIGGGCKINGHLEIADRTILTGGTEVGTSIRESGQMYSSGMGAFKNADWRKLFVRLRKLDQMAKRISALEKQGRTHDDIQQND